MDGRLRQTSVRFGIALAVAALPAFVLAGCGGGSNTRGEATTQSVRTVTTIAFAPFGPLAATPAELSTISGVLGQPVYWAGAKSGFTYEIRRGADGSVFLRYLPAGTAAGAKGAAVGKKPSFLTIATYPLSDAYAAIVRASKHKGSTLVRIPNKGLAVYGTKSPWTYYFAFPGSKYQVGVFAPTAAIARRLVLRGHVVPVA